MVSEHFVNDVHSRNLISPGCLQWGEINISIPSGDSVDVFQ